MLFAALASALLAGVMVVGYPYLVRTVLALPSGYYGAAESAAGAWRRYWEAPLAGDVSPRAAAASPAPPCCARGWPCCPLPPPLRPAWVGSPPLSYWLSLFPSRRRRAAHFPWRAITRIQSLTPEHLTGKVMSFVYTLSMCAQPLGQIIYGALFDALPPAWVLAPSAVLVLVCAAVSTAETGRAAKH